MIKNKEQNNIDKNLPRSSSATYQKSEKEDTLIYAITQVKRINVLEEKIKNLEKRTEEKIKKLDEVIKTDVEKITKETKDELSDKIDDSKLKTIETLGIFVALFTFVSVEFQVFRMLDDPQSIAGLTLILLGSLLTFITVLDSVLSKVKLQEDIKFKVLKPKSWPLVFIWMLLIILGGALFVFFSK